MYNLAIEKVKTLAFFLWEYTKFDNTLALWECAEDIACHFEEIGIIEMLKFKEIEMFGNYSLQKTMLVRNVAFRIFVYTNHDNPAFNWYTAERLLENTEWCLNLVELAKIYSLKKDDAEFVKTIRSQKVRNFYS